MKDYEKEMIDYVVSAKNEVREDIARNLVAILNDKMIARVTHVSLEKVERFRKEFEQENP